MYSDNWYFPCPYAALPYLWRSYDPRNSFGYYNTMNGYYRFESDYDSKDFEIVNSERTPQDVDRVVRLIYQRSAREINEILKIGMDRRLLEYLIRSIVSFIDRRYNRYRGTLEQRSEAAIRDIRQQLHWIFDIMNLFSISPTTYSRLLDEIVKISFQNLRRAQPPVSTPR